MVVTLPRAEGKPQIENSKMRQGRVLNLNVDSLSKMPCHVVNGQRKTAGPGT